MDGVFGAGRRRPRADPDPRRPRPAAARRRARRPRPAPSRRGADPRARRDLRPGDPHLTPCRPPGRALRHLLLLPARRDRAVRARPRRADRVRLRSPLRHARHHALHGAARGPAGRPRRGDHARRCSAARWRRCSTAVACPPSAPPRRGPSITLSGPARARVRLREPRRPGPVQPAPPSRHARCSTWRSQPAAIPSRGPTARRSRRSERRSSAAGALLGSEDGTARGDRPRLPRDRARRHRDPRQRPDQHAAYGRSHTAAHSPLIAPLTLAQAETVGEGAGDLVDLLAAAGRRPAGARARGHQPGELEQQRTQQVRDHHDRTRGSRLVDPRQRLRRRSKRRTSICDAVRRPRSRSRPQRSRARGRARAPDRTRVAQRRSRAPPSRCRRPATARQAAR